MQSFENIDLVDTHCHLDLDAFDPDREQVLERARAAGVRRILIPGIDLASSRAAVRLAEAYPEVYAAVGLHPNEALQYQEGTLAVLHDLSQHEKVVAIGEIGLDYYRDRAPKPLQQEVFRLQLELAEDRKLPVIIHNRKASEDLLRILHLWRSEQINRQTADEDRAGVLHSYSEDEATARQAIDLGFFIGITGPVTFRNAPILQRVVATLPPERLLIETDAPFLAPHPHRGQRNEPAYVRLVAEKIALIKNQPLTEFAAQTWANAERLFKW